MVGFKSRVPRGAKGGGGNVLKTKQKVLAPRKKPGKNADYPQLKTAAYFGSLVYTIYYTKNGAYSIAFVKYDM